MEGTGDTRSQARSKGAKGKLTKKMKDQQKWYDSVPLIHPWRKTYEKEHVLLSTRTEVPFLSVANGEDLAPRQVYSPSP